MMLQPSDRVCDHRVWWCGKYDAPFTDQRTSTTPPSECVALDIFRGPCECCNTHETDRHPASHHGCGWWTMVREATP